MKTLLLLGVLAGVYDTDERIEYLRSALDALDATELERLMDTSAYIDVMDRNECRSIYHRLRAQCLVEVARRNCRSQRGRDVRRACTLTSDVIVTNKLSESEFVDTTERYLIMQRHRDFRSRMREELRRRYGALVTGFSLSTHFRCDAGDRGCLARSIHDYCAEYADTRSLSWQHCAAAITWFIGTTRE